MNAPCIALDNGTRVKLRSMGLGDIMRIQPILETALPFATQNSTILNLLPLCGVLGPRLVTWLETLVVGLTTLTDYSRLIVALLDHPDLLAYLTNIAPADAPTRHRRAERPLEIRQILHLVQQCYGWPDQYILNDPWSDREFLSYSRWLEIVQSVVEAQQEERQERWQRAAFVGWQNYCLQPRGEDAPPKMGLDEWLEMFGLKELDNLDERDDEEFAQDVNDLLARFGLEF